MNDAYIDTRVKKHDIELFNVDLSENNLTSLDWNKAYNSISGKVI